MDVQTARKHRKVPRARLLHYLFLACNTKCVKTMQFLFFFPTLCLFVVFLCEKTHQICKPQEKIHLCNLRSRLKIITNELTNLPTNKTFFVIMICLNFILCLQNKGNKCTLFKVRKMYFQFVKQPQHLICRIHFG